MKFPENKQFVFTILDDTDSATLENIEPIYRYLHKIGMRTTKTVWPLPYEDHLNSPFMHSATLADADYLEFVRWLNAEGFEISWHGATMETSERAEVIEGLNVFHKKLGFYPSLHVNHAINADNIYWGLNRFENTFLRTALRLYGYRQGDFCGEVAGSQSYWGDYVEKHIKYCRSFSFSELDSLAFNPSLPYQDSRRSLVDYWFSTATVDSVVEFESLVSERNIDNLASNGGICILSTHLGKGYCKNGEVRDSIKRILDYIANKDGWFVPVSHVLDWRVSQGFGKQLPYLERFSQEFRWVVSQALRKVNSRLKKVEWWEY